MTLGARSGLTELHERFRERVRFLSVYVREAHPGERHAHHQSLQQKLRHAREWREEDGVRWPVAVDELEGTTHQAYGGLPNALYLIDSTGHVAFRALWAGQQKLIERKLRELIEREERGELPANLGEQENLLVPMLKGGAGFERAMERGGDKARADFRREMGIAVYGVQRLLSRLQPVIDPRSPARRGAA